MKRSLVLFTILITVYACGNQNNKATDSNENTSTTATSENANYDPERGEGKFSNVEVSSTIDGAKATAGEKVYSVKCSSCHKLSDEKLVGPGWKGVTGRYKPEWIMNFATNPDPMIDKDPKVQAQLEICLVRMPNQNISDEEARNIYEFMRKNDAKK
jgi:cytochrome c551/c552